MIAWRYEISLLVLKKYFTSERSKRVKYFSTLEQKFCISARSCNILYLFSAANILLQGCALAEPGGPWRLTFALGRLENHRFFIQIICWAP